MENNYNFNMNEYQKPYTNPNLNMQVSFLHKLYESRSISDILAQSHKVMELDPNNLFANFLYNYCLYRKGNNSGLKKFFTNFSVDNNINKDDAKIIADELTKSYDMYKEKVTLLNKLSDASLISISDYNVFMSYKQKQLSKKEQSVYIKNINIWTTILTLLFPIIISIIIYTSSFDQLFDTLYDVGQEYSLIFWIAFDIFIFFMFADGILVSILGFTIGYPKGLMITSIFICLPYLVFRSIISFFVYKVYLSKSKYKNKTYTEFFLAKKVK